MTRILIAYATKHNTTREIAEAMAETLRSQGLEIDVTAASAVTDVSRYDAVVLGTSIYMGSVVKDAVKFAARHEAPLRGRPVAGFLVGMGFAKPKEDTMELAEKALNPIRAHVDLAELGTFAGRMNPSFMPVIGFFRRYDETKTEDARDWDAIRAWAASLPEKLGLAVAGDDSA
jgi:menaquinone-dependent protoporphyrinogen oxidase